jgi:hypothetical protein
MHRCNGKAPDMIGIAPELRALINAHQIALPGFE